MKRILACSAAALAVLASTATAHHSVPQVKQDKLVPTYNRLYKAASKTPKVNEGRNVVKQGRSKDGKFKWTVVRSEVNRLWLDLHPEVKAEHEARLMYPTPLWWRAYIRPLTNCESGSNPRTNTGNEFYGKYQFTLQTWRGMGGTTRPDLASEQEQDYRAYRLWNGGSGAGNWPVCRYRMGG